MVGTDGNEQLEDNNVNQGKLLDNSRKRLCGDMFYIREKR